MADSPVDLSRLPRLTALRVTARPVPDLSVLPELTELCLHGCPPTPVPDLPLTTLTVVNTPVGPTLDAPPTLKHLLLHNAKVKCLVLNGALESLTVFGHLERLEGEPQHLDQLTMRQTRFDTLDLGAWRCPKVTLDGGRFKRIQLPDDCVVASLKRTARLREVAVSTVQRGVLLSGSKLARREVPMSWRWMCTWNAKARLEREALRQPPQPRTPVDNAHRTPLSRIRAMLRGRERESVDQALELLTALDRPEWWDALLDGCRYEAIQGGPGGKDKPSRLKHPSIRGCLASYALTGLLATAPEGATKAIALRQSVVRLDEVGRSNEADRRLLNPAFLEGLPKLSMLVAKRARVVDQPGVLTVRRLHLAEMRGCETLAWLNAPRLRQLYVYDWYGRAVDLTGLVAPALKTAVFAGLQVRRADQLNACAQLRDATFYWSRADLHWTDQHPSLQQLTVDYNIDRGLLPQRSVRRIYRTPVGLA